MARSRLEKVGTIFTRNSGLIRSGALNWEDRPLWYDVYATFPPFEEPTFDRPVPNIKLRNIFYKEDKIRSVIHKNNKRTETINLLDNNYKSLTHKFIEYRNKENQHDEIIKEEVVAFLDRQGLVERERKPDSISISSVFKKVLSNQDK